MTDADGDPDVIEDLANVGRVDSLDGEGNRTPAGDRVDRADDRYTVDVC